MASSSSSSITLPFATMIHMITVKLSSTNYLLWRKQVESLLLSQNLFSIIDGSHPSPPQFTQSTPNAAGRPLPTPNPDYTIWLSQDRNIMSLLLSSLTEEALAETLGCNSAREVWTALEAAYSNRTKAREIHLKDELQLLKRGSRSITDFGRNFQTLCDRLAAIGSPVANIDKVHWFLRGLGPSFSSFSAVQLAQSPLPSFRDLLSKAESFDLFQASMEASPPPPAAFYSQTAPLLPTPGHPPSPSQFSRGGRSGRSSWRGSFRGGRNSGRRPPRCQLCRQNGHYAEKCPQRFDRSYSYHSANLSEAFHSACNISSSPHPDWYVDTGATAHMTPSSAALTDPAQYSGMDSVLVGNGASLPISHVGNHRINSGIDLKDVFVVPALTKNLLSVSKLAKDHFVSVTSTDRSFVIQSRDP